MSWLSFLNKIEFSKRNALLDQATHTRLTYKDLYSETCGWIQYFESQDLNPGDRVAYYSLNSKEHLTLLFACAKLRLIFVPLNFRLTIPEIQKTLDMVSPKILMTSKKCSLKGSFKKVQMNEITLKSEKDYDFKNINPEDPCLMLFTSGSSGQPKGVLFHGKMIQANLRNTVQAWKLNTHDKCLVETPFFHTGAYNVLCLPLLSIGAEVILAQKFCLDNFYSTLQAEKITVYFGVPTMFGAIAEDKRFKISDFQSLRFLISGGAACSSELITKYQQKNLMFKQGFGLTEVGPNCFLLEEEYATSKLGSIGKPMANSKVRVIDENNIDVEVGHVGELIISGDHVCLGFFRREKDFEESFVEGYYRTGDLCMCDKDGFYYIKGRKKEMYISGGENVYPAEVEARICEHQDIIEAQVVAVSDQKWGEVGFAYIRSQKEITLTDLREYLNANLSRYKHPFHLKQVEEFPLLANGKINKIALKQEALRSVENV